MNEIDAQIEQLIKARNSKGLSSEEELELTRLQILSNDSDPERDFPTSLIKNSSSISDAVREARELLDELKKQYQLDSES